MSDTTRPTADLLVQHVRWLRGLAHHLVRDAHLAEDLAQETVTRALQQPPTESSRLRNWLAKVLRNLVSERRRSQANQDARERRSARRDSVPPTDELVERLQVQRNLADALAALDEPFRTAVLLRFYEGLAPRQIAARLDVPVATVKSRLQRGLDRLRQNLDRSYGDRQTWVCALLPLAGRLQPLPVVPTLGGIAVNAKIWLSAGGALAAACALAFLWPFGEESSAAPENGRDITQATGLSGSVGGGSSLGGSAPQRAVAEDPGGVATGQIQPAVLRRVAGQLLDSSGRALGGMAVETEGGIEATSNPDGWFVLETEESSLRLSISESGWTTVRRGTWRQDGAVDPVVVAARSIDIDGVVIDDRGQAVAGASLRLAMPDTFQSRFRIALDSTLQADWRSSADERGGFRFEGIPAIRDAALQVTCDGYEAAVVDMPVTAVAGMTVRLFRSADATDVSAWRGQVLRPEGGPAAGARVRMGSAIARANTRGFFAFRPEEVGGADQIVAVDVGFRPVAEARPESTSGFAVLRLRERALNLGGRVLDTDGNPVADAKVWILDPTPFGVMGMLPLQTEGLSGGSPLPPLALESATWQPDRFDKSRGSACPARTSNAMIPWVRTDEQGRFLLKGLDARDYRLQVLDGNLGWSHRTGPMVAGQTDADIRLPKPDVWPEVRGRVVTRHGDAVPGVSITPFWNVLDERVGVTGGESHITRWFQGRAVRCAEDGTFVMKDVPKKELAFFLVSDQMLPAYGASDYIDDPLNVVIPVEARAHIEVELSQPEFADAVRVRDEDGKQLEILRMRADGYSTAQVLALDNGRSGVITVTSAAATVDFLKGDVVVATVPVRLRPGIVHTVRR